MPLLMEHPAVVKTAEETELLVDKTATPEIKPRVVTKNKKFYAPELDALRFGAFILVFCRHITSQFAALKGRAFGSALRTNGADALHPTVAHDSWSVFQGFTQSMDFGVCLFFFLSAFLITRLLLLERDATGKIQIFDFYVRRSLRIWPLYFFFLGVVVVLSYWLPVLHAERSRVLTSLVFVSNWTAVLHGWSSVSIQPLWSVSVEEQFYAFWPWFARSGRKGILRVSLVLAFVAVGTLLFLSRRPGLEVTGAWPNTFVQMIFFAGGACTAVFSRPEVARWKVGVRFGLLGAGFLSWVTASAGFHVVRTQSPGALSLIAGYLLALLGTYMIFSAVAGWNITRIPGWLAYLGRISYGLYVFHVAALILVEQVVFPRLFTYAPVATRSLLLGESLVGVGGLALTMVCAMTSYRFIEKPFLKLKKSFTVVSSRPA